MKFKQDEVKRIRCSDCKRVKNATLIHVTKGHEKRKHGLIVKKVDTFTLQYMMEKHQRGTKLCLGSGKVQSTEYDGVIDSIF